MRSRKIDGAKYKNAPDGRLTASSRSVTTFSISMSLRAGSTRLSYLTRRQRSLLAISSIGALTATLGAVNWRSITHGHGQHATYRVLVTPSTIFRRSLHSAQGLFSALNFNASDTMASLTPPQAAPTWTHSAEDVMKLTKEAIEEDRKVQNKVAAIAPKDCGFASVCLLS